MNKLISTVQRVQHYLLLEQNIFLKYRLHFADSTWIKIRDLMGFFSLINSRCLNSYDIASRPISRKFLGSMGMASRGRSPPFLQLSNTYLKNWPNPAEKICIHSTNTVSGLTPPGDTILANTDCSFAPPPFPNIENDNYSLLLGLVYFLQLVVHLWCWHMPWYCGALIFRSGRIEWRWTGWCWNWCWN